MNHDLDHNEQELQLLYRGIKRANGFHLYLAQCDNHRLNYARDLLPKKIPVPLVLWLPTTAFNKILTEAHDLWSWRSGTFYFSGPPETGLEMLELHEEIYPPVDREGQGTISEKFYKEQLDYFTYLLEDLDSNADSGTARLRQADVMQQISELHHSYARTLLQPDQRTGCLEKALEYQIKALEIKELIMDKHHPEVAKNYANLSSIYEDMLQPDRALEFQLKAIAIREAVLDKNHPDLANSYHNISTIYRDMNDHASALLYAEKAAAIMQKLFPNGHPNLDKAKKNLERLRGKTGDSQFTTT
jgi:tetratricopeptide (TPR) repeat protein